MKVQRIEAPCDGEVHLYLVGDEHVGTKHHAKKALAQTIAEIRDDPVARWIGMGDKCEFIAPSDPRWDGGAIESWVSPDNVALDQSDYYCDVMAPIASKCDGLLWGNHEQSIKRHCHIDVQKYICDKLGVRDLMFMSWVRYCFKPTATQVATVNALVTHGSGNARTRGAKMNRLEWLMNGWNADLFGHGHMHEIITHPGLPYMDLTRDLKLKQKEKQGAVTGCYFRTYTQDVPSSYGEQMTLPPTMIGSPMFTISIDSQANPSISVTA